MARDGEGPESSAAALWLVLTRAQRSARAFLQSGVTLHGINIPEFEILEALLHKGALSLPDLGQKVGTPDGTIASSAEQLEARGLLRRRDQRSGDRLLVELTNSGRELIEVVYSVHEQDIVMVMDALSPAERSQLRAALKKIGHRSDQLMHSRLEARSGNLAAWQLRRAVEMMTGKNRRSGQPGRSCERRWSVRIIFPSRV